MMSESPQSEQYRTTQPLVRTVNNLKNTTTNIRGFADSMDHLLNAFEEFFPFIEHVAQQTEKVTQYLQLPGFRRRPYRQPPP